MTTEEATKYGRKVTLRLTGTLLGLYLLVNLFEETRGDFGNGFLFFLAGAFNGILLLLYAIVFGLTYLFGGWAAKEVIISGKNPYLVVLKYPLMITFTITAYIIIVIRIHQNSVGGNIPQNPDFISSVLIYSLLTAALLTLAWFLAAYNMSKLKHKNNSVSE